MFENRNTIGIIICYFGKWPQWFPAFIKSCIKNRSIDWLFFSDQVIMEPSQNIKVHHFSLTQFNKLTTTKLGITIKIKDPYKLCDFKPAYGIIFEDYLNEYSYWGYSDIDLLFGKLDFFIDKTILGNFDVINSYANYISGAFCLFRNSDYVNTLFKKAQNWEKVFKDSRHWGFDENIQLNNNQNTLTNKLLLITHYIKYLCRQIATKPYILFQWQEFRYQFQWYLKKKKTKGDLLRDMTEVIWFEKTNHKLKIWSDNLVWSDKYLKRTRNLNWEIIWQNGNLFEKKSGRSLMAFHFLESKERSSFKEGTVSNIDKISISNNGFKNA